MNDPAAIEAEIRDALKSSTDAVALSNRLFAPEGLFHQLAATEDERRRLTRSPLFQTAQRRLAELRLAESRVFANRVDQSQEPNVQPTR